MMYPGTVGSAGQFGGFIRSVSVIAQTPPVAGVLASPFGLAVVRIERLSNVELAIPTSSIVVPGLTSNGMSQIPL